MSEGFLINKKTNSGVSLIELVVIIAIMAIVVGSISIGIGMVSTQPATQCASNIEICLNRCRIHTMGKTKGFVAFYEESDGIYMLESLGDYSDPTIDESKLSNTEVTKKRIGKKGVVLSVDGENPTTGPVFFEFNRSDGSLEESSQSEIYVIKGRKCHRVEVQPPTGKVILHKNWTEG